MHAAAQKIARALISHVPFHRCARKISRFARNDDTGESDTLIFRLLETLFPLAFIPRVPYPPLRGTFPSRGRLWVWGSGILVSLPSPWQEGFWISPSFLWKEVPRRGGGWLPQRDEGEYTIVRPPVSSSRAQPRDLSCRRENSTYEEVRHSKSYEVRCLPLSHIFCLTSVQGRFLDFARNDDTGKALLSFSACLRCVSPLSFIPPVPYPPLRGTFPSRGRLLGRGQRYSRFAAFSMAGRILDFSLLPLEGGAPKGRRLALAAG